MAVLQKRLQRKTRHKRGRRQISGTSERPRLSVYRSNVHVYAQLIDDERGHTLVAADSREVGGADNRKDAARKTGELLAERARAENIETVVFDRGGNKYHGRIA